MPDSISRDTFTSSCTLEFSEATNSQSKRVYRLTLTQKQITPRSMPAPRQSETQNATELCSRFATRSTTRKLVKRTELSAKLVYGRDAYVLRNVSMRRLRHAQGIQTLKERKQKVKRVCVMNEMLLIRTM